MSARYFLTVTTACRSYVLSWPDAPWSRLLAGLVRRTLQASTLSDNHHRYRSQRVLLTRLTTA